MKILVLESSGNIRGSSNMLADEFIRGAEENGHEVTVYNVIRKNIKPCLGCGNCGMSGMCVLQDDYENELKPLIIARMVLGRGCGTPSMTRSSDYPKQAYELGKSI